MRRTEGLDVKPSSGWLPSARLFASSIERGQAIVMCLLGNGAHACAQEAHTLTHDSLFMRGEVSVSRRHQGRLKQGHVCAQRGAPTLLVRGAQARRQRPGCTCGRASGGRRRRPRRGARAPAQGCARAPAGRRRGPRWGPARPHRCSSGGCRRAAWTASGARGRRGRGPRRGGPSTRRCRLCCQVRWATSAHDWQRIGITIYSMVHRGMASDQGTGHDIRQRA